MKVNDIILKLTCSSETITDEEIKSLLAIDTHSEDFYRLIAASNAYSRKHFDNKGYVFVQIGLNGEPCSGNCLFCSMGAKHFSINKKWRKSKEEILEEIHRLNLDEIDDLFLMTTADYRLEDYLDVVSMVKPLLKDDIRLVANIRDFTYEEALTLKDKGLTGAYHVNRLREGIDTSIPVAKRLQSLDAIKKAGLELYYCIEPIGAEHSADEILTEIRRAERLRPEVMAVMRRVNYPNSPLADRPTISAIELVKIAAVSNLVIKPTRAMNLHESEQMSLLAGVNQLYAEIGANPRDVYHKTEEGRGLSVAQTREMLRSAEYVVK